MKYPMILERLLKATDKSKSDYEMLERAHNNMVEVNKRINKGKEDVQGQMKMFDFLKEIENCPPTLLSAQRHYISECDVKLLYRIEETKEVVALENYEFRLYLFSDNILVNDKWCSYWNTWLTIICTVVQKAYSQAKQFSVCQRTQL